MQTQTTQLLPRLSSSQ